MKLPKSKVAAWDAGIYLVLAFLSIPILNAVNEGEGNLSLFLLFAFIIFPMGLLISPFVYSISLDLDLILSAILNAGLIYILVSLLEKGRISKIGVGLVIMLAIVGAFYGGQFTGAAWGFPWFFIIPSITAPENLVYYIETVLPIMFNIAIVYFLGLGIEKLLRRNSKP